MKIFLNPIVNKSCEEYIFYTINETQIFNINFFKIYFGNHLNFNILKDFYDSLLNLTNLFKHFPIFAIYFVKVNKSLNKVIDAIVTKNKFINYFRFDKKFFAFIKFIKF